MKYLNELGREFNKRNNPAPYTPIFATVSSVAPLSFDAGDRITIDGDLIRQIADVSDSDVGKKAVLFPTSSGLYIFAGVVK